MTTKDSSFNWPKIEANRIMAAYPDHAPFDNRRPILIWAAKRNSCPKCDAAPYTPCMNLTSRKQNIEKFTRWPHEERVDWGMLVKALREKGFRINR